MRIFQNTLSYNLPEKNPPYNRSKQHSPSRTSLNLPKLCNCCPLIIRLRCDFCATTRAIFNKSIGTDPPCTQLLSRKICKSWMPMFSILLSCAPTVTQSRESPHLNLSQLLSFTWSRVSLSSWILWSLRRQTSDAFPFFFFYFFLFFTSVCFWSMYVSVCMCLF